jgi:hypothetical protein
MFEPVDKFYWVSGKGNGFGDLITILIQLHIEWLSIRPKLLTLNA